MDFKRYTIYNKDTECSVKDCHRSADYEVILYDYYTSPLNEEFFEQDYTCPFICEHHMNENEQQARGERRPRGFVRYPYTNKYGAQGFTKYLPIIELYPVLLDEEAKILFPETRLLISDVNRELIQYLARKPELLRDVHPRKFEQIIAEIFSDKGFHVELTPSTRDGGFDMFALKNDMFGKLLYLVECKRYATTNKVGVEIVRALNGVLNQHRATAGIIVTTSSFTSGAIDFATPFQHQMSLKDFEDLKGWLSEYKG